MQINSLLQSVASQAAGRVNSAKTTTPIQSTPAPNAASADQLDLSAEAQALISSQASSTANVGSAADSGLRVDKIAAIRQAIADGSYETPEKLDVALDRMLDTFA